MMKTRILQQSSIFSLPSNIVLTGHPSFSVLRRSCYSTYLTKGKVHLQTRSPPFGQYCLPFRLRAENLTFRLYSSSPALKNSPVQTAFPPPSLTAPTPLASKIAEVSASHVTTPKTDVVPWPLNINPSLTEKQAEEIYKALWKPIQPLDNMYNKIFGKRLQTERSAWFLYEYTTLHAENKDFYDMYGIKPNLMGWYALMNLHMWMIVVRTRVDGYAGIKFANKVFQYFWKDLDRRLIPLKEAHSFPLGREKKKLLRIFHGMILGYDEGLLKGDHMLADALWRNLFSCEDVSAQHLLSLVAYVRRELAALDSIPSEDFIFRAATTWGRPINPNKLPPQPHQTDVTERD